jgi:hypothetical protein
MGIPAPALTKAQTEAVRAHLECVLAATVSSASVRRAQLLRYLVERALSGEGDRVNEYAIGSMFSANRHRSTPGSIQLSDRSSAGCGKS